MSDDKSDTYNVKSVNQTGGITAGKINIGPQPRNLDREILLQRQLLEELAPYRESGVVLRVNMGDTEADAFARQIAVFLIDNGFNCSPNGPTVVVCSPPLSGLSLGGVQDDGRYLLNIGSL